MGQPLKILVVTAMYPNLERPGYGVFVRQQVQSLQALGHNVEVESFPGYRNRLYYLTTLVKVFWRTMRQGFDVVHAHYGLAGASALLRWKTPLVVTFHGSDVLSGGYQRIICRIVSWIAAENIVVSKAIRNFINGELIPCGVDFNLFRPIDPYLARDKLGLDQKGEIVLFPFDTARKVKRFDLLEKAVKIIESRGRTIKILTIHTVPQERMPLYYAAANLTLICSESEGSSTCLKESLACGTPVLSTDVGDARELLERLDVGAVVNGQPDSIAEAMMEMLDRRERKRSIPPDFYHFDEQAIAERVVRVYRKAVMRYRRDSKLIFL